MSKGQSSKSEIIPCVLIQIQYKNAIWGGMWNSTGDGKKAGSLVQLQKLIK